MEPIRNVVELNGNPVSRNDNLTKNDFKTGDRVTIFPQKSKFEGIVDFTRERDTVEQAESSTRRSTPRLVPSNNGDPTPGSPSVENVIDRKAANVPASEMDSPRKCVHAHSKSPKKDHWPQKKRNQ